MGQTTILSGYLKKIETYGTELRQGAKNKMDR